MMTLREFVARENLYEYEQTGTCGGGFTPKYIATEALYFSIYLPPDLAQIASKRRK